ncbi:MAG: N-acetylmuramoyl-L-alanine amidase [Dorea sp.]|jgi:N-acetyl-anhydromuramyl-L-alanine amidase AmpD|nr:N-acetylmuramoyl-L-alanine amidase [Dorea sp.]
MKEKKKKKTKQIKTQGKTTKDRKEKKEKNKKKLRRNIYIGIAILTVLLAVIVLIKVFKPSWFTDKYFEVTGEKIEAVEPDIDVELLTVNPYSRPGTPTEKITGIVVHYTANPGATAIDNRNYFESLKDGHDTQVSSNFIVGLEGEIVQCVPTWEMAYASNNRNIDTVSIECCHPDETGVFNEKTYKSMVQLCAWLCMKFDLKEDAVIRHFDVTGKNCPKYFVEDEEAWQKFRQDIGETLKAFKS